MTVSTHTYTAFLLGTPDQQVLLRAAAITLDDTAAPHVQASVTVSAADASLYGLLDPRVKRRIRVDVQATIGAFGTQTRSFDLGLRERSVRHSQGVVVLRLASDEALLDDYAPLANDTNPYLYQSSIRSLVNYVLGVAISGASLAAGTADPAIRALITSINLVRNPRAKSDLTDWSSSNSISRVATGGPAGCATYVNTQSGSAGNLLVNYSADGVPLQAGKRYRISVWQNTDAGVMTAIDGLVLNSSGTILTDLIETPQAAPAGWFRRTMEFTAVSGAVKVQLRSFTTVSVAAGRSLNTTGWRVSEVTDDPTDTSFFDDTTTATSEYSYAASGATSVRTALVDRASDLLTWRAGVSALDFLAPILQMLGLRLVCDESRLWTLRDDSYVAPGSLTIRHGVNLIDADDVLSRDDDEWFDAAVVRYRWRDLAGNQLERVDAFTLTTPPTQVRTFEKTTPYPGPGFAEYAVRRAQSRGRQVSATEVADWTTRAEQPSEFTLLGATVQLGKVSRVVFDLDRDEMTVTSRTTDTVLGAIDLLAGVIDALPGVIDSL